MIVAEVHACHLQCVEVTLISKVLRLKHHYILLMY